MNYLQKKTKEFTLANLALFAAGFITFANLYITQPLGPQFSKELGVTPAVATTLKHFLPRPLHFSCYNEFFISTILGSKSDLFIWHCPYAHGQLRYLGSSVEGTVGEFFLDAFRLERGHWIYRLFYRAKWFTTCT